MSEFGGEEGEEDMDLSHLPPDHPLLKRIQDAISKQLLQHKEKLAVDIRTKEDEFKLAARKRDELGVELYGVQQQLAKLHQGLEKSQAAYQAALDLRQNAEQKLVSLTQNHKLKKEGLELVKTKHELQRQDLEKVAGQVHQVEQHAKQVASQIAVAKRAAHKAEVDITDLEKTKLDQDLVIDSLTQQLAQLESQRGLYDAQIVSQRQETKGAIQILSQAASEMDGITVEKKQLLQQWKNALLGMERRDEVLRLKEEATQKVRESLNLMDAEANGFKLATKIEQDKNEQLTQILNKSNNEIEFLDKKIAGINENREKLTREYSQLQRVLEHTEAELSKVMGERNGLEEEANSQQRQGDLIVNETVKVENQIRDNLQIQKTIEKGSASTAVGVNKMVLTIEEKYMQVAQLQNELSKMRVDSLSTQANVQTLEQQLSSILEELREKDRLVEKYEQEIRRRNDEIERKQSEVDRLNRKYDQLASNHQDENTGPLEATIHNLTNEIAAKRRECASLQHYWLKAQTDMVNLSKEYQELLGLIADLQGQYTILKQKRLRVNSNFETSTNEIRQMEGNVRMLRNDMQKFNLLIAKNSSLQGELQEQNLFLETEFMGKLREMESEAISLEERIEDSRLEKERILQEIVDTENVKMLWEKKIQLGKETQEALDPNVGAAEHRAMRKEIGRMEFKLSNLKREQEQLIQEMESAIARRESFVLRGLQKQSKTAAQVKANASAQAKKEMAEKSKRTKQMRSDLMSFENMLHNLWEASQEASSDAESSESDQETLSSKHDNLSKSLDELAAEKQMKFDETTSMQSLVKKYSMPDIEQKFDTREVAVERELARQVEKGQKIEQLLDAVKDAFPEYYEGFSRCIAVQNTKGIVLPSTPSPGSTHRAIQEDGGSGGRSPKVRESNGSGNITPGSGRTVPQTPPGKSSTPNGVANASRNGTPNGSRSHRSNA